MADRIIFGIGGCAYRMQVHAQHAACLAALAGFSAAQGQDGVPAYRLAHYQHTSNLPKGRCEWLRRMIADRELTHAVSMDADTWCQPFELLREMRLVSDDIAMGIAPVRQGDGRFNVRTLGMRHVTKIEPMFGTDLGAGGFGLVVFQLAWFRSHWPEPSPETTGFDTGEDIEMCKSVRARGGRITCLRVGTAHASFQA